MSRKKKAPPAPPSKAYLVSFGDTMTALLAFFIVLNSFAKDQTGANMHSGTGSFVNAVSSIGLPGTAPGKRSHQVLEKKAPAPIYAVSDPDQDEESPSRLGPDGKGDSKRIIDRQSDEFKRFLTEIGRQFEVNEEPLVRKSFLILSKSSPGKTVVPSRRCKKMLSKSRPMRLVNFKTKSLSLRLSFGRRCQV